MFDDGLIQEFYENSKGQFSHSQEVHRRDPGEVSATSSSDG